MTDDETTAVETKPKRAHRRTRALPVEAAPTPKPAAAPTLSNGTPDRLVEMEEWDATIAARRLPIDEAPARHPLNYNYPLAHVRRPDGQIVQLQSDPNNRMMYEDLGFVYLSVRETRQWL